MGSDFEKPIVSCCHVQHFDPELEKTMSQSVVLASDTPAAGSCGAPPAFPRIGDGFVDASHRAAAGWDTVSRLEWFDTQWPSVWSDARSDAGERGVVVQAVPCLGRISGALNNVQTEGMPGTLFEQTAEDGIAKFDTSGPGPHHWLKARLGGWRYEFLERFAFDWRGFIP